MWDNKYSDETDDGFFAIDEHLIKERYEEYKSVIRSPIESAQMNWEKNMKAGSLNASSMLSSQVGQPLKLSRFQMTNCLKVSASKALIIHQEDYSLTRLIYPSF